MNQTQIISLHEQADSMPPEEIQTQPWLRYLAVDGLSGAIFGREIREEDLPALAEMEQQVRAHRDYLAGWMRPADPKYLGICLKRLSLHYHLPEMTETERESFWMDYQRDIGDVPDDLIEMACERWRKRKENRFFPRPCELLELCEERLKSRKRKLDTLDGWLRKYEELKDSDLSENDFLEMAKLRGLT